MEGRWLDDFIEITNLMFSTAFAIFQNFEKSMPLKKHIT